MRMNLRVATGVLPPEARGTRSFLRSRITAAAMMTGMALLFNGLALAQEGSVGAVYTATNAPAGNSVLIFSRSASGALTSAGSISTQGNGLGVGLCSQGSVMLSPDGKWLLVVNAGSNDVTVFSVSNSGLEFRSRTGSGGSTPVSITILGDVVYVLNRGATPPALVLPSVAGFRLGPQGTLTAIPGALQTLSNAQFPAQVAFAPKGGLLVVTDINASLIFTLQVNNDVAGVPVSHQSAGLNPFGFSFDGLNQLLVSEANLSGISSVSSYDVTAGGALNTVTASATTFQSQACWLVVTRDGKFAYVSDPGSFAITGFAVAPDGRLSIVDSTGVSAPLGSGSSPFDIGLTANSQFLYSLVISSTDSITGWRTNLADGSLVFAGSVSGGIPSYASGIAVH